MKVIASSVNPFDWKIRSGTHPICQKLSLPLVLGWDLSGIVESLGKNVSDYKEGDAVYALSSVFRQGSYAEYVVVDQAELCLKPECITHLEAAGIPLVSITAWQALFKHGKLEEGLIELEKGL